MKYSIYNPDVVGLYVESIGCANNRENVHCLPQNQNLKYHVVKSNSLTPFNQVFTSFSTLFGNGEELISKDGTSYWYDYQGVSTVKTGLYNNYTHADVLYNPDTNVLSLTNVKTFVDFWTIWWDQGGNGYGALRANGDKVYIGAEYLTSNGEAFSSTIDNPGGDYQENSYTITGLDGGIYFNTYGYDTSVGAYVGYIDPITNQKIGNMPNGVRVKLDGWSPYGEQLYGVDAKGNLLTYSMSNSKNQWYCRTKASNYTQVNLTDETTGDNVKYHAPNVVMNFPEGLRMMATSAERYYTLKDTYNSYTIEAYSLIDVDNCKLTKNQTTSAVKSVTDKYLIVNSFSPSPLKATSYVEPISMLSNGLDGGN